MMRVPRFERDPVRITWWEILGGSLLVVLAAAALIAGAAVFAGSLGIILVALEGAPR